MAWMITCECGEVARAETDEELISAVERHVKEQHPEMVGRLSREQILGMAEVV
jgi:predicted small metal-binding protein